MDGKSQNITEEQINRLKELFPEVFTEGKIDWNRLKATLGDHVDLGERYGLSWKGKSGVFAKIQEQTIATLHPQPEESVDWDTTQNMFIEGDNLEALKVLHKAYYGKVKMIYIDPPYNTGNDFVYNDDFKQARREYETEAGIVDEEGNITRDDGLRVNSGGHKHSNWLNMMYPRLFLARNLLRQDGVIFVSIDDNEVHNLHLVMNEIFGEENFRGTIAVRRGTKSVQAQFDSIDKLGIAFEYILLYSRNSQTRLPNLYFELSEEKTGSWNNHWRGTDRPTMRYEIFDIIPERGQWRWSKERSLTAIANYNHALKEIGKDNPSQEEIDNWYMQQGEELDLLRLSKTGRPEHYVPPSNVKFGNNLWTDLLIGASSSLKRIDLNLFDNPKNPEVIKRMLAWIAKDPDSIVLDFFAGSGTLAHAVMELNAEDGGNRKWICVQLPEFTDEKSEAYKAGYRTIAQIARERIRRAAKKIAEDHKDKIAQRETPLDLGFRAYVLGDSNFKKWNELVSDPEEIRTQIFDHIDPIEPGAKDEDLLIEILLKRGISPLAKIEQHDGFVFVPDENLAISLARNMTEELFKSMLAKNPSQIIILDVAFNNDLNLKTNLVLQSEKQNTGLEIL